MIYRSVLIVGVLLFAPGCASFVVTSTDGQIHRLIAQSQVDTLGGIHDADIGAETGDVGSRIDAYKFNPHPLGSTLPASFQGPPRQPTPIPEPRQEAESSTDEDTEAEEQVLSADIFAESERDQVLTMNLSDALGYAIRHARELQDAKEDLYLAALDLSLERHLWTPQFVANVTSNFTNFPDGEDLDRAMTTVSEAAVTMRLPFGGQVGARVIHSVMREVRDLVSAGESGQAILDAQIPLLRGAGHTAFETRYSAERELIYAVRTHERFRRTFLVGIAADYFNLQQTKASIENTYKAYLSRKKIWKKADFIELMGQSRDVFEAPRARSNFRESEARLVSAKERYESALDRFKIRINMSVTTRLEVVSQDDDASATAVDDLMPQIEEAAAVETAIRYRLDLLTDLDQVDDTRRGVEIAKNRILPDLDLTGSVAFDSDAAQLRGANLREERSTWRGSVRLRVDDRKTERNAYRASLIRLRRAQRDHERFEDSVRADVRRALRRIGQQDDLRLIQSLNVRENERRLEAANAQYNLGRSTNQDVVDAEDDLLDGRNSLADAVSGYRIAILEFRRDTGTLRIDDDGRWEDAGTVGAAAPPPSSTPDDGS